MFDIRKIVKNLLPQDTRIIELTSAFALICSGLSVMFGGSVPPELNMHPPLFWIVLLSILGLLQLRALIRYPTDEPLRILMSWMTGSFWAFYAIVTKINTLSELLVMILAAGLLVGFLINITILSETWKD